MKKKYLIPSTRIADANMLVFVLANSNVETGKGGTSIDSKRRFSGVDVDDSDDFWSSSK